MTSNIFQFGFIKLDDIDDFNAYINHYNQINNTNQIKDYNKIINFTEYIDCF
jgi:hypothetical protein